MPAAVAPVSMALRKEPATNAEKRATGPTTVPKKAQQQAEEEQALEASINQEEVEDIKEARATPEAEAQTSHALNAKSQATLLPTVPTEVLRQEQAPLMDLEGVPRTEEEAPHMEVEQRRGSLRRLEGTLAARPATSRVINAKSRVISLRTARTGLPR